MQTKQHEIVKSVCNRCGKEYWSTEEYKEEVKRGISQPLCIFCDEQYVMEDDDSVEFDYDDPSIEDR